MNRFRFSGSLIFARCRDGMAVLALMGCLGCQSLTDSDTTTIASINPDEPFVFPGESPNGSAGSGELTTPSPPPPPPPIASASAGGAPALRVGEKIIVIYSDIPQPPMPHEQRIREDGRISLPLIGSVMAAGKTPGQLEDEIHEAYVPRFFRRITVVVDADERQFSVGGEVRISNRQLYSDRITVLRAIQAAGDFTDFADRKRIEVIRASGRKEFVNWYDAKDNPKLDLEVFPGDQIIVPKRAF